ncbi:MAG: hypothetical protein SPJ29_04150 [Phocaeicola sp.]|nr:hypothetical protein [Phocaeicola sp.]MDY5938929.1 hypothetical protein [Phocaeicola sp.]
MAVEILLQAQYLWHCFKCVHRQDSPFHSEHLPYQQQIPDGDYSLKRSCIDDILVNNLRFEQL